MPLINLIDSSCEQVLHSYGFHLVSAYKYEISNCLFDYIYLLDTHLSLLN
jgi:TRAP-type mannitol/chloroaromatic compound transport system permease small subunit